MTYYECIAGDGKMHFYFHCSEDDNQEINNLAISGLIERDFWMLKKQFNFGVTINRWSPTKKQWVFFSKRLINPNDFKFEA